MERESFEDDTVAKLLNEHFIAIKVDREERPDVDLLYMSVCQAMTGQGGWPLTIIMTPEKKPFFAGTYFPRNKKYGRPGLIELLSSIHDIWMQDPDRITSVTGQIVEEISNRQNHKQQGEMTEAAIDDALANYVHTFDTTYGGFGGAPKFPNAHNLSLLLRVYRRNGDASALRMVETTLQAMYAGGMYDHIGFGFSRYSTDTRWLVPHFEKMLYDNALLATAYIEAYQVTGNSFYADVAKHIFTYVLRDMTHPDGGFYSAEDADSEGEEGKFYVWTPEEVSAVLGDGDGALFCELYDITDSGNFEGSNIPNLLKGSLEQFASDKGWTAGQAGEWMEECRTKLFEDREKRVHPGKDDKVLTSWNGLMIAAFAQGYKVFREPQYLQAAQHAARFIDETLRDSSGRLLARYRDGEAKYAGYVDDYANMIYGFVELYEATFEIGYMERALELYKDMVRLFWDDADGGFFFTGKDSEQLLTRMKEVYDGAMPSGNSVAAYVMQRLAHLTGDEAIQEMADKQVQAFAGTVSRYPNGYAMFVQAALFAIGPSREIVIAGKLGEEQTQEFIYYIWKQFAPQTTVALHSSGPEGEKARHLMPAIEGKDLVDDQPAVYICENFACHSPVSQIEELKRQLT